MFLRNSRLCSSSLFRASAQDFGAGASHSRRNLANPIGNPMIRRLVESAILSAVLGSALLGRAQTFEAPPVRIQPTPLAATAQTSVPALIPYSGVVENSKAPAGPMAMTFLIYKEEQGGEPLWAESQTVSVDEQHHYSATLGATLSKGLPDDLFSSGEARWLEVQAAGQAPQRRILMMSVPYALKAADATTLGGLPVSAFALAGSNTVSNASPAQASPDGVSSNAVTNVTTAGGTSGYLPLFNAASSVTNSTLFQSGSFLGVNLATPLAALDVNGEHIQRGTLLMFSTGAATSAAGKNSQPITFEASGYNSSTKADVTSFFTLQSETSNNNTSAPYGTLHLLYGNNTTPTETGLYINNNGTIHFAPGQTFQTNSGGSIAVDGVSTTGYGVEGESTSNAGILGTSTSGSGIIGSTVGGTLHTAGVYGSATAPNTSGFNGIAGVWGDSNSHVGILGTSTQYSGVQGQSYSSYGVQGSSVNGFALYGFSANSYGLYAQTNTSATGIAAIYGYSAGSTVGVKGASASGNGGEFYGGANSVGGNGVLAVGGAASGSSGEGGNGGSFTGGSSSTENGGDGVIAAGGTGMYSGGSGLQATGGSSSEDGGEGGVFYGGSGGSGFYGGDGIFASAGGGTYQGEAAFFEGNVSVAGTLSADAKDFRIDHPTDPANKYLNHASVESSEMVNIYSGNVTTDENGLATVALPDWFQSVNGDFRYQLTIVGRKAQAWIAREIANGTFQIASDATNTKVSWQVTGVRQDAYAKAHPLVVEQVKSPQEKGLYKHPELYGQSSTKGIGAKRHSRPVASVPVASGSIASPAAGDLAHR
jgi:hypothetical protein